MVPASPRLFANYAFSERKNNKYIKLFVNEGILIKFKM